MPAPASTSKSISGFDPRSVGGCQLWLDASDSRTLSPNTGIVSTWTDKTVNASVGTSSGSPTIVANVQNGLSCMSFTAASSQYFNFGNILNVVTTGFTVFCVAKTTFVSGTSQTLIAKSASIAQAGRWGILYDSTNSSQLESLIDVAAAGGSLAAYSAVPYSGVFAIFESTWNLSSLISYVNGIKTASSAPTGTPGTNSDSMFVGAYQSTGGTTPVAGFYFNGSIGEILVYNSALNSQQRTAVEGYLAWKWGVQSVLTSPHPFLSIGPQTRSFNPSDFAGLVIWSDANDYSTLGFGTSPALSTWYNKASCNAGYATTITGSPTWLSNSGPNGFPIVRFASTPATWTVTSDPVSIPYMTLFWMGRQNGGTNGRVLANTNSATCNVLYGYWGTRQQVLYLQGNPNQLGGIASSTAWGLFSLSQNCNLAYQMNWFGSNLYSGTTNAMPGIVGLGINKYGAEYSDCDVCEILVYSNVLTTTQIQQVEGYLSWKWGLQSLLSNGHPFSKFPTSSPSYFSPTNTAGCILWLDSSDKSTTGGVTNITTWLDKSGKGNTATNQGSAGTITYTTAGLVFNGSGYMYIPGIAGTLIGTPFVVFIVETLNSTAGVGIFGEDSVATLGTDNGLHILYRSPTDFTFAFYSDDLEDTVISGTGTKRLWTCWLPTAANRVLRRNGTVDVTHTNFTRLNYFTTPTIGRVFGGAFYNGTISEIIVYSSDIGLEAIQRIEGYLAQKWSLTASLPATHPYKKFSPSQISQPSVVLSLTISLTGATITTTWLASVDAFNYTIKLYSAATSAGPFTTLVSTQTITGVLTTTFTVSATAYYEIFALVNGAGGPSLSSNTSYVSYTVPSGYTFSFASTGNPISYINSYGVANGATTFSGSAGASETNSFYSYTNDIAAPVAKGVTKNATRNTINLPANTTGTQTTFLSYGPYNTSYTLGGSMPTGFSTSAHTVIMIMYHLGTTAAIGGGGGEGQGNVVASGGILYAMGRTSIGGNFNIAGEVVTGENGAWDYNGGFSMSINSTTVNIQSKVGWVMVAFVWRAGTTCSYYYNGSTAMSTGGGNGASSMSGTIYIGVDQRDTYYGGIPGNNLNAEIAFYGLWNSALTSTQIGNFYTANSGQFGTFV
jgi:hypothetical protein